MTLSSDSQLGFGPLPLQRLENAPRNGNSDGLQKVELPLDDAKVAVGRAVARALTRSGSTLKKFGDPSQVRRWCSGLENPSLARLWTCPEMRRELLVALAEESGCALVDVTIRVGRIA